MKRTFIRSVSISILTLTFLTLCYTGSIIILEKYNSLKADLETTKETLSITQGTLDSVLKDYSIIKENLTKNQQELSKHIEIERTILSKKSVSRGGVTRTYTFTIEDQLKKTPLNMRATAYDLTVASCGKSSSHSEYGITRTGERVIYKTTVAVDPSYIPLGSILYVEFPKKYKSMTGIYKAMDTGNAVKGNIIDIYVGEDETEFCDTFGIQPVKVYVLS